MASEIINGGSDDAGETNPLVWASAIERPEDGDTSGIHEVPVRVGADMVSAIALHDMPAMHVMDLMMSFGEFRMIKSMLMFKVAVGAPGESKLDIATFQELYEATNAWIRASNELKDAHPSKPSSPFGFGNVS